MEYTWRRGTRGHLRVFVYVLTGVWCELELEARSLHCAVSLASCFPRDAGRSQDLDLLHISKFRTWEAGGQTWKPSSGCRSMRSSLGAGR